jgi:hypothetical protein
VLLLRTMLLLGAVLAPATVPDVVPPGHRRVQNELVLEWGEAFAELQFVASPTRGFGGHEPIRRGQPFGFSGKYGTRIHALPRTAVLPPAGAALAADAGASARVPVAAVWLVAASNPLARVVTTLRVVAVDDATIGFERIGEQRFTSGGLELSGPTWLPLLAIGLCGAAWLWRLDRQRRALAPPGAAPS